MISDKATRIICCFVLINFSKGKVNKKNGFKLHPGFRFILPGKFEVDLIDLLGFILISIKVFLLFLYFPT